MADKVLTSLPRYENIHLTQTTSRGRGLAVVSEPLEVGLKRLETILDGKRILVAFTTHPKTKKTIFWKLPLEERKVTPVGTVR